MTVKDLIELLQKMPQNSVVEVEHVADGYKQYYTEVEEVFYANGEGFATVVLR
jgi:hypothetical protein